MIKSFFKHIFQIASAVVLFCTFLSYLVPYVHPKWSTWLTHFATAFPWLLLLNLAAIAFWLFNRNRFAIYHGLFLIFGWSHITAFVGLSSALPKTSRAMTIMSHNTGTMLQGKNLASQWDKAVTDYVQFIKKNGDPDVLCLQESEGVVRELLIKKAGYPHHFTQGKGTLVLSRYPLDAGADIPFENTGNCALWVNLTVNKQKIRLYNIHLQSNFISGQTDKLLESGEIDDKESWRKARSILSSVGSYTKKRTAQAELVLKSMEKTTDPILLCGDFNDTPNSYVYRLLSEKLTDTFQSKGRGLGYTFAGSLPLLRIDYTFASEHFTVLDAGVVHKRISDHYPTYAVLHIGAE
jgi:endonuclease/exonuclease/phosphatase family metal-dependent hydrolase